MVLCMLWIYITLSWHFTSEDDWKCAIWLASKKSISKILVTENTAADNLFLGNKRSITKSSLGSLVLQEKAQSVGYSPESSAVPSLYSLLRHCPTQVQVFKTRLKNSQKMCWHTMKHFLRACESILRLGLRLPKVRKQERKAIILKETK